MEGLLLVDKPIGWTSFDVVNKIRGVSGIKRVGHAGTLDPLASGLLLVCIGPACKQVERLMKLDKIYEASLHLGETSTTADGEGEKQPVSGRVPTEDEIRQCLAGFIGPQLQTPPAYSAVKIGGVRAYKLARKGREVKIEPRQVTIHSLELIRYEYPTIELAASVSSGTYIRSLAVDIGDKLGTGAWLAGLRRTRIGEFDLENAISPEGIETATIESRLQPVAR